MGETKANQVSFKVDDQTVARIQAGMTREDIASQADFCRKINKYGLELFEKLGSLAKFRDLIDSARTSPSVPVSYIEALDQKVKSDAQKQAKLEKTIHARATAKTKRRANNEQEDGKAG